MPYLNSTYNRQQETKRNHSINIKKMWVKSNSQKIIWKLHRSGLQIITPYQSKTGLGDILCSLSVLWVYYEGPIMNSFVTYIPLGV